MIEAKNAVETISSYLPFSLRVSMMAIISWCVVGFFVLYDKRDNLLSYASEIVNVVSGEFDAVAASEVVQVLEAMGFIDLIVFGFVLSLGLVLISALQRVLQ